MGFFVRVRGGLKKKGLFLSSRISIKQIVDAILDGARRTPLEAVTSSEKYREDGFDIMLHPAAGPLKVEVAQDWVTIETKTSTVGPGFHAYVVSILEHAERSLGLKWEWEDETGYAADRSFESLQAQMAFFLNHLAISLLKTIEAEGATGMKIFMPVDFAAEPLENEIFTPMGPVTEETLRGWASADAGGQIAVAADFFTWWGQGFDGSFYRGIALYALWMDMRWTAPLDDAELRAMQRTVGWCTEAVKLGAALPVPSSAVTEIQELLVSEVPRPFPNSEGIGYRRRLFDMALTDNWTLTVPGAMERSVVQVGGSPTVLFRTHLLQIRVSISGGPRPAGDQRIPAGVMQMDRRIVQSKENTDYFALSMMAKVSATEHEDEICIVTFSAAIILRDLVETLQGGLKYNGPGFNDED